MHGHKLCVLVLMDILFRTRETKIVAFDTLPRLNYYKKCFCDRGSATDPAESLITACWIW